jgi:hypothetical protein
MPTALPKARVDMKIGGAWVDITCDVRGTDRVVINRGRANEASHADPSTCNLTLLNPAGKYTPRNPRSAYYGLIGRNTGLRAGLGTPPLGAGSTGLTGTALAAPSVTAETAGWLFSSWLAAPVGNLTVPGGFTAATERDGLYSTIRTGYKSVAAGATGTSTATFSTAATAAAAMSVVVPGPITAAVDAGVDTNTGDIPISAIPATAGQYLLAIYGWSADPDDRMSTVGDADGGCEWMLIADTGPSTGPRLKALIRRVTATGNQNLMFYGDTRASFTDTFGQVFVLTGASDYYPRFTGEVPSWSPKWDDPTGRGAYTPIQATGITRRLGHNAPPLRSPIFRELLLAGSVTAYWPLEDAAGATSFGSAIGGPPMLFAGVPQPAADSGFAGSDPIPTFTAAGATGAVPAHTATNQFTVGALIHVPATGMLDESLLLAVTTSGTARTWTIKYDDGSQGFRIEVYNAAAVKVKEVAIGPWDPVVPGARFFLYLTAAVSGANIAWTLTYVWIGTDSTDAPFYSDTVTAQTVGAVTSVAVGGNLDLAGEPSIGHVVATSSSTTLWAAGSVYKSLVAWNGETAVERILRLCQEESIPVYLQYGAVSELMGPQRSATLPTLLGDCETADGGVLYEPKGFLGLAYRTRASKYNQTPELTLSYSAEQVAAPFGPVDDDLALTNDVTVTRRNGSTARSTLTTGALSTREPPNGVGLYDSTTDLNVHDDAQLPDQASWRLHLGTWDEARYPTTTVNLANLAKTPTLVGAVTALDVGDLASVTNLPTFLPPGPADLIVEGYQETIGNPNDWVLTANCSPAGPYRVGVFDSTAARYSSDGSTLAAGVTSAATTLSVATPAGPLWIRTATHPAEFPFDIVAAGEQVTVTAITGTTSPQTFTVTRAVNGVAKAQVAGATVELYRPAVYAL